MDTPPVERALLEAIMEGLGGGGPEPLLARVLEVTVGACGAHRGYLAVHARGDDGNGHPRWWTATGFEDEALTSVRAAVSGGVLQEAMASGEVVLSSSALADPRFRSRESVQFGRIEAVLASRVGEQGVIYLQGPRAGMFDKDERALLERLVVWMAPLMERISSFIADPTDPTAPFRTGGRFEAMVGRSRALANLLQSATAFAAVDAPVLISGETGTGKSVLAESIHQASRRAEGPFVVVNAAAIPDALLEAELFGAEVGAYTGAVQRTLGKIRAAEGGTLFLDEVAELSPSAQAKLLLFTQDGHYTPLGESNPRKADVRLVAATNASLEEAVADGRFRLDLLHRLDVLRLEVPTLRERIEDIPLLIEDLGRRLAARHGVRWSGVTGEAMGWLQAQPWPGNIRQLANVLERALLLGGGAGPMAREDIEPHLRPPQGMGAFGVPLDGTLHDAVRGVQRQRIQAALSQTDGVMRDAAEVLGISRSRLYELCRDLDIHRPG